jgi:hypothetical protein
MTTMECCPRVPLHTSTNSLGSSDPRIEGNLDQQQEITSDVSDDSWSIYVLSDPPSALPTPAAPHPSTCSTCAAFYPPSRLMPRGEGENSSTGAIPGSSTDVTHDWESVRSVRRLSTNKNGNSKCSINVRDSTGCTPHDTDESESLALDEDALHDAHRWDLIPEYSLFGVSRDTVSPVCMAVRSSYRGCRRNNRTGSRRIQRLPHSLPHHIHIHVSGYPCSPFSSPCFL